MKTLNKFSRFTNLFKANIMLIPEEDTLRHKEDSSENTLIRFLVISSAKNITRMDISDSAWKYALISNSSKIIKKL